MPITIPPVSIFLKNKKTGLPLQKPGFERSLAPAQHLESFSVTTRRSLTGKDGMLSGVAICSNER